MKTSPERSNRLVRRAGSPRLALLLALLLGAGLSGCGGGGGGTPPPDAGNQQALAVSRPGELVSYVQARLRQRQVQGTQTPGVVFDTAAPTLAAPATTGGSTAPARSSTLVQEDGVDEADLLQSDGEHFYTLHADGSNTLDLKVLARAADGSAVPLKTLRLESPDAYSVQTDGMHISADGHTLAVISQAWDQLAPAPQCPLDACSTLPWVGWMHSSVQVQRVDATDPAAASAGQRLAIDGHLIDSRRVGDTLVLVTSHTPQLAPEMLPATATAAEREAAIAAVKAADVLPRVRLNGGTSQPLLSETDCYLQATNASLALEITTITVIDLKSPLLARTSRCFAGGSEAIYMTQDTLYVATTRNAYLVRSGPVPLLYPAETSTDIHKFALAGGVPAYRGSGEVRGHLGWDTERKSYRLSEYQGDLRVLTYTASMGWAVAADAATVPASPALLTVLREDASGPVLKAVSTLPNATRTALLGKPGEQVYAVRFVGDRGYVVTFRRSDPLYVLDLSNPAEPRAVGELETAGYSEQLVPLPGGLLLGVGRDADANGTVTGLKVALFDVADAAHPAVLGSTSLGGAWSSSALDASRHGLNLLVTAGVARIALPVNLAPPPARATVDAWVHGLQRFEVDLAARRLNTLSMVGESVAGLNTWDVGTERSLQVGDQVYYLSGGELTAYTW